jgi:hypothetical protein
MILDPDLVLLEDVAVFLDARLNQMQEEARRTDDPDATGVFDRLEHVTGLGFAACQNYIVSCSGLNRVSKQRALELGPKHHTGEPMVALVNAAANYWKHSSEWNSMRGPGPGQRTGELFASLGVAFSEYCLTTFLYELVRPLPPRFATVVPFLVRWRDDLAAG